MDPVALPAPAPEAPPVAGAPAPAPEPVASIAVPDPTTAAGELQGLVGAAGGDSTLAIALALIAVLGGGSAFKLYQKRAEHAHELKLKELEMKSQIPSQSPPPCILKHGELDAKLAALEAQVEKVAAKARAAGLPAGFDPDDIEERLEKLEKAAAAKKKA